MRVTKEFKNNKGITLVSLIITIVVMVIISSVTLYTSMDRFKLNELEKLYNDIRFLSDKVSNYYLKYNGLPVLRDKYSNEIIKYTYFTLEFEKNEADNENYYIIDLEAIGGLSLSYGKEGFENPNESDDVFIINEKTHQIYYVKGIESEGVVHYTILDKISDIEDTIPPTKPEIKIISGKLNNDKTEYITEVQIEIVPGKDNWSGIYETISNITRDGELIDIETLKQDNGLYMISENGTYLITVTTKDNSENKNSSTTELTIVVEIPENIS